MAIAIYSHSVSDSVNALSNLFRERNVRHIKLRRERSTYNPRQTDVIFNYGSRNQMITDIYNRAVVAGTQFLNTPSSVNRAANKVNAFNALRDAGVPTVEFTTETETARDWINNGSTVYSRTVLNGHSGEGIHIAEDIDDFVEAPLYTKGITLQRREFRVHVMRGTVIYVQQKKRVEGWRDLPEYSERIRNHHTGWIYATSDINPNEACISSAIAAVNALGLDFGAVDVITRHDHAWVLEVNTAPGLTGTTLETYAQNLINLQNNQPIIPWTVSNANTDTQQQQAVAQSTTSQQEQRNPTPVQEPVSPPVQQTIRPRNNTYYVVSELTPNSQRKVALFENRHFVFAGLEIPVSPQELIIHREVSLD